VAKVHARINERFNEFGLVRGCHKTGCSKTSAQRAARGRQPGWINAAKSLEPP
jgi:hypothetical protein